MINNNTKIAIVGLGYVGLPLAYAFAKADFPVIGFDIQAEKIKAYKSGIDLTNEVGDAEIKEAKNILFTNNPDFLKDANFIIIAVPTPVSQNKTPDLRAIKAASEITGKYLQKNMTVIYESTVYPGLTQEICIPILEEISQLKCGKDFKVGYSPERINPGDKEHRLENIIKIVAGIDSDSTDLIAKLYNKIIKAGIYKAESIKVAEAAKIIENTQRDINIAFINEIALIFDKLDINTQQVLKAAKTKWNFLDFQPGLVGGHCIGVDPYYLAHKAMEIGVHPQIILAGRRINDAMGKHIANKAIKKLIDHGYAVKNSKVLILGLTFKENCPDTRNSKVYDIIAELKSYGVNVITHDPYVNATDLQQTPDINIVSLDAINNINAVIIAVNHAEYKKLSLTQIKSWFDPKHNKYLLLDIKGVLNNMHMDESMDYCLI